MFDQFVVFCYEKFDKTLQQVLDGCVNKAEVNTGRTCHHYVIASNQMRYY